MVKKGKLLAICYFNLFEQRKSFEGEDLRQKQYRLLFNTLDRQLLKRKYTNTDLIKDKKLRTKYHKLQTRKRKDAISNVISGIFP